MNPVLSLFHSMLSGSSFDRFKPIADTLISDIPGVSALCISEQTAKDRKAITQIVAAKKAQENFYLVFEAVPKRAKQGYRLFAVPTCIDIPNEEGTNYKLYPNLNDTFQINPAVLSGEYGKNVEISLGNSEQYLRILSETPPPSTDIWEPWFNYGLQIFELTCGEPLNNITIKIESLLKKPFSLQCYIAKAETDNAKARIDGLYKALLSETKESLSNTALPKVIDAFYQKKMGKKLANNFLLDKVSNKPDYLLGHMDESKPEKFCDLRDRELFALDNTQRQVIVALGNCQQGDVLAVNGPPGSGKTAMLKAVIANQWVYAALHDEPCPITLAVGATNQSVTNVIEAFPNVPYQGNVESLQLFRRWIPYCKSYGSFLPSTTKLKEIPVAQRTNMVLAQLARGNKPVIFEWLDDNADMSDLSKLDAIESYYLEQATLYVNQKHQNLNTLELTEVIKLMQLDLKHNIGQMLQCRKRLFKSLDGNNMAYIERLLNLLNNTNLDHIFRLKENENQPEQAANTLKTLFILIKSTNQNEKLDIIHEVCREKIRDDGLIDSPEVILDLQKETGIILIDRYLDIAYRTIHFHLAARYWEGVYIRDCQSRIIITNTSKNVVEGLRRMCMITPCLVSTIHNAPGLLQVESQGVGELATFAFGALDLLIMDETGQAPIRLALPLLSLTKKALAVGDIKQLAPVVNDITPLQEQLHFYFAGFDDKTYANLYLKGLTVCKGSMLHLVRLASSYSYQGDGMTLRGHYRCQQKIIQLCNEMVYENKLFYLPNLAKADKYFPPISWVASSAKTQSIKNSRANEQEAQIIVEFVLEQWPQLFEFYSKDEPKSIGDIMAIVTPFRPQGEKIKSILKDAVSSNQISATLKVEDIDKLTIGTVDSLQGSEKPIIIFSGVQGIQDGSKPFFAEQPFLINVAVSRAKDSFIAFVCPDLYKITTKYNEKEVEQLKSDSIGFMGYYLAKSAQRLFPQNLVIIEAPGKLKILQKLLGTNYEIIATGGAIHQLGLEESALSSKTGLRPCYQLTEQGKKFIEKLINKVSDTKQVILATDDDYVGEAIAWHVQHQLLKKIPDCADKIRRVRLSAITENEVKRAFDNSTTVDTCRVSAEIAREVSDILIARKLYESLKHHSDHSDYPELINQSLAADLVSTVAIRHEKTKQGMGRVKSGVLDLLLQKVKCELQQAAQQDNVDVVIKVNGKCIQGRLIDNSQTLSEKVNKANDPISVRSDKWKIVNQDVSERIVSPPGTSTIEVLQKAWSQHQMKPQDVMAALQYLYEGDF